MTNPVTIVTTGQNPVTSVTTGQNPVTPVIGGGNLVTLTTSGVNPVTLIPDGGLSADFSSGLPAGWTLTRAAGTATTMPVDGSLDDAIADTERFRKDEGILVEEARTNQFTQSIDLGNAAWTKTQFEASPAESDSGYNSGGLFLLVPNSTSASHWFSQSTNCTSGLTYTESFVAKAGGYGFVQITGSTGFSTQYCNVNLTTGEIGNNNLTSASVKTEPDLYTGGWVISYTDACVLTTTSRFLVGVLNADTASRLPAYSGDTTSGVYFGRLQMEQGTERTSYIPTTTSVSRGIEALSYSSDAYNQSGSAIATIESVNDGTILQFGSGNDLVKLSIVSGALTATITDGGVSRAAITGSAVTKGDKVGLAWSDGDVRLYLSGAADGTASGTPMPAKADISTFNVGSTNVPDDHINGPINSVEVHTFALSDSIMKSKTVRTYYDWYVDADAAAGGDGSLATPWDTFSDIDIATIEADEATTRRVHIRGTFNLSFAAGWMPDGVAGRPVELRFDDSDRAGIVDVTGLSIVYVMVMTSKDYIDVYGAELTGGKNAGSTDGMGFFASEAEHVRLYNCNVHDNYFTGIGFTKSNNCVVSGCTVTDNLVKGIVFSDIAPQLCHSNTITGNTVTGQGRYGMVIGGANGAYNKPPDGASIQPIIVELNTVTGNYSGIWSEWGDGVIIRNNNITANTLTGVDPGGDFTNRNNGIGIQAGRNMTVYSNTITGSQKSAIYTEKGNAGDLMNDNSILSNWIEHDGTTHGIDFGALTDTTMSGTEIVGNVVILGSSHSCINMAEEDLSGGFVCNNVLSGGADGYTDVNNGRTLANNVMLGQVDKALEADSASLTLSNNYYGLNAAQTEVLAAHNGSGTKTDTDILDIDSAANFEAKATSFTDSDNDDYTLAAGSTLRSAGVKWWSGDTPVNQDGDDFSDPPNIGAY